jgi:23S rRNA pseudouridine2604 synthase
MCQESGYKVESLTRVRIMNIELGGLKIGEYRIIEGKEKTMLYESL